MIYRKMRNGMAVQLLIALSFVTLFWPFTAKGAHQSAAEVLEKIKQSPSVPTRFHNTPGSPITIESSSSKEISNVEYSKLVGINTTSERVSSFPDVVLFNNTDKRVISFVLLLKNEQAEVIRFIKSNRTSIQPYSNYLIDAIRWAQWDKQSQQPPGLESEKMWLIGRAKDYVVIVAEVNFDDGSKWVIKDETATPTGYNLKISHAAFSAIFRSDAYLRRARYSFSCT